MRKTLADVVGVTPQAKDVKCSSCDLRHAGFYVNDLSGTTLGNFIALGFLPHLVAAKTVIQPSAHWCCCMVCLNISWTAYFIHRTW